MDSYSTKVSCDYLLYMDSELSTNEQIYTAICNELKITGIEIPLIKVNAIFLETGPTEYGYVWIQNKKVCDLLTGENKKGEYFIHAEYGTASKSNIKKWWEEVIDFAARRVIGECSEEDKKFEIYTKPNDPDSNVYIKLYSLQLYNIIRGFNPDGSVRLKPYDSEEYSLKNLNMMRRYDLLDSDYDSDSMISYDFQITLKNRFIEEWSNEYNLYDNKTLDKSSIYYPKIKQENGRELIVQIHKNCELNTEQLNIFVEYNDEQKEKAKDIRDDDDNDDIGLSDSQKLYLNKDKYVPNGYYLKFKKAMISKPDDDYESHVLFAHNIPDWITLNDLMKEFECFAINKKKITYNTGEITFPKIIFCPSKKYGKRRNVFVNFKEGSNDACFAYTMCRRLKLQNPNGGTDILYFSYKKKYN